MEHHERPEEAAHPPVPVQRVRRDGRVGPRRGRALPALGRQRLPPARRVPEVHEGHLHESHGLRLRPHGRSDDRPAVRVRVLLPREHLGTRDDRERRAAFVFEAVAAPVHRASFARRRVLVLVGTNPRAALAALDIPRAFPLARFWGKCFLSRSRKADTKPQRSPEPSDKREGASQRMGPMRQRLTHTCKQQLELQITAAFSAHSNSNPTVPKPPTSNIDSRQHVDISSTRRRQPERHTPHAAPRAFIRP